MKVERSAEPILFFSKKEKKMIMDAIRESELKTSGEIRVHLERQASENILEHAKEVFQKIGMTQTQDRNGVLIFMGVKYKRFAILGDQGIHEKVSPHFWDEIVQGAGSAFKEDRFAEGLVGAIQTIGEKLKQHFPYQRNDVNELPDEISYSL